MLIFSKCQSIFARVLLMFDVFPYHFSQMKLEQDYSHFLQVPSIQDMLKQANRGLFFRREAFDGRTQLS